MSHFTQYGHSSIAYGFQPHFSEYQSAYSEFEQYRINFAPHQPHYTDPWEVPAEKDDDEVRVVRGVNGTKQVTSWKTFEQVRLHFPEGLVDILTDGRVASFAKPTNVQAYSWPTLLAGEDMISIAKTGSGKTLAFLLPGFIRVKQRAGGEKKGPQLCVLAPTRELCQQIYVESVKFGEPANIYSACAYGGCDKGPQLRKFHRKPQVAIGCPGRLLDYLNNGEVNLSCADYFVLDEGDRMLDMGFEPQIRMIVSHLPQVRQTLLFSATWPREVQHIARSICDKDAVHIQVGTSDSLTANADITQHVIFVSSVMDKWNYLKRILADTVIHAPYHSSVLVFSNTKVGCAELARGIKHNLQIFASALHGDMDQKSRDFTLQRFKEGKDLVMVATDVAQRGLDVRNVAVVVNWDVPTNPEDYVHRIGRTGRSGEPGISWAFLAKEEVRMAQEIMRLMQKSGQDIPQDLQDVVGAIAPPNKKGKSRKEPGPHSKKAGCADKGAKGFGHHCDDDKRRRNGDDHKGGGKKGLLEGKHGKWALGETKGAPGIGKGVAFARSSGGW